MIKTWKPGGASEEWSFTVKEFFLNQGFLPVR